VLLVEGEGDREAVPVLLRALFSHIGRPECSPASHPLRCGDLPKLLREGALEKFVTYACKRPDGDSVLLVVDCDDDCPPNVVDTLARRAAPIGERVQKRIGLALMHREFETLFLYAVPHLAEVFPKIPWKIEDWSEAQDWTEVRGAKETLRHHMGGRLYKETRHQASFVSALDYGTLEARCRSLAHLITTLRWLTGAESLGPVHPTPST
jgi:hypothetical protein